MKYLQYILIALMILLTAGTGMAQQTSDINNSRMNRDINIMENILAEMFKTGIDSEGHAVRTIDFFRNRRQIKGIYLPGYGVIFTIPSHFSNPLFLRFYRDDDDDRSFSFTYVSEETNNKEITEESVVNRIEEFLREYGSTIGQLEDDENIMVIYGTNRSDNPLAIVASSKSDDEEDNTIPTISVAISKSDLSAYRSGNLNADRLENRMSVEKINKDQRRQMDMEVMANIFETAFEDPEESFRIRGSVNYLKLDNFGALFFTDARHNNKAQSVLRKGFRISTNNKGQVIATNKEDERVNLSDEGREEIRKEVKTAYSNFVSSFKEYMVDYGRTLKSVGSGQFILASINLSSDFEEIPERVDIQVKKSILEAVDQGSMSRDDAINRIVVREY